MISKIKSGRWQSGGTIVSLATTAPEFCVSFLATVQGKSDIAIGNSIGSCVINIGLIAGTSILIRPILAEKKRILEQGAFMIAAGILVYFLSMGGVLTRFDGIILITGMIAYLYYCAKTARKDMKNNNDAGIQAAEEQKIKLGKQFLMFAIGAVGIVAGSSLLVRAAPNAIAYDSRQFTSGEFFLYGIPANMILMIVVGLAVFFIWPWMGKPVTVSG